MRKSLVFSIVVLAILGVLFVLSMDDDPPDDAHLVVDEGAMPTEGNGFLLLLECLEAMDWPEDDVWIASISRDELAVNPDILDLLERNQTALACMADAAEAPEFQLPPRTDLEGPTFMTATRQLGRLAAIDATVRVAGGDEDGAFERLFQYLALGHRLESVGELIHYLVGSALQVAALQNILDVAADSDGEGLEALAARVEDYAWEREAMEHTLGREYVFMTQMIDQSVEHAGWKDVPVMGRYLYQPNRTRKLYADSFTAVIDGLGEECATAPRESEKITMPKWRYLAPNSIGYILHNIGVPNLDGFAFGRCRDQMTIGLTRLALAARAYRADVGELPGSLDALVPRYLDEPPVDVDGKAFRYSREEEYLYSVGLDRLDHGGGEPSFQVDWDGPDPGVSLRSR